MAALKTHLQLRGHNRPTQCGRSDVPLERVTADPEECDCLTCHHTLEFEGDQWLVKEIYRDPCPECTEFGRDGLPTLLCTDPEDGRPRGRGCEYCFGDGRVTRRELIPINLFDGV